MTFSVKQDIEQKKDILSAFYRALETNTLSRLHLYHSNVHYIRAAIEERTGLRHSLAEIEKSVSNFTRDTNKKTNITAQHK
jgi:hypothetical protein|tara:strand:- start:296 stop:538 length:243 start_codon:yes stop_codon:yes gene_type:complete